jgi:hypothetical protein
MMLCVALPSGDFGMVVVLNTGSFTTTASKGCVLLDGSGLAITLSPEAALQLADLLTDASTMAFGQRVMKQAAKQKPI